MIHRLENRCPTHSCIPVYINLYLSGFKTRRSAKAFRYMNSRPSFTDVTTDQASCEWYYPSLVLTVQ
ncbi:hypothetical protein K435DRAFT_125961 [Dendrothele bispora CBS 962.96]|uniref:Uncharacterized protein n=1 Tax=Dendrothele bispora (strain CBS 962.96) TaxID=1314807 RepID=A0A4S8M0E1_DENBC|nr:hypothetical protein K435DRAFT_125961 [Dendrothele bispora CBS 962.96]